MHNVSTAWYRSLDKKTEFNGRFSPEHVLLSLALENVTGEEEDEMGCGDVHAFGELTKVVFGLSVCLLSGFSPQRQCGIYGYFCLSGKSLMK